MLVKMRKNKISKNFSKLHLLSLDQCLYFGGLLGSQELIILLLGVVIQLHVSLVLEVVGQCGSALHSSVPELTDLQHGIEMVLFRC
jgi:hypothetical protein